MKGKLILEDGTEIDGLSFGAKTPISGEVVFATGMTGYPESFTDTSYLGQILILTYPLVGNYGVPNKLFWESQGIKISGLIVSSYNPTPSHFTSEKTLSDWLQEENVPALEIKDTRFLTQKIRESGTMLGKIVFDKDITLYDPDKDNLVAKASTKKVIEDLPAGRQGKTMKTILLFDCGAKANIARCLVKRGVKVVTVPWDFDPSRNNIKFDGVLISNGPGNPKRADKTIAIIKKLLDKKIPMLGVCLGNQILTLASGGDTEKLKYGHRGQNQPATLVGTDRCYITTQNHGYHVSVVPPHFKPWFINANDGSNEGIMHDSLPIMSVQFHPEATPGPHDTEWVFDYFLEKI